MREEMPEIHAIQRARERYGLELDKTTLRNIEEVLSRGGGQLLLTDGGNEELREISIGMFPDSVVARVVFSPKTGRILTFLPRDVSLSACYAQVAELRRALRRSIKGVIRGELQRKDSGDKLSLLTIYSRNAVWKSHWD
jgi:hypothetical protein